MLHSVGTSWNYLRYSIQFFFGEGRRISAFALGHAHEMDPWVILVNSARRYASNYRSESNWLLLETGGKGHPYLYRKQNPQILSEKECVELLLFVWI